MWFTSEKIQDLRTNLQNKFNFLSDFYNFICDNNPTIMDFSYKNEDINIEDKETPTIIDPVVSKPEEIYENKYLDKFKAFNNEMHFTELELEEEAKEYERIKTKLETDRTKIVNECEKKLALINEFEEKGRDETTQTINEVGKGIILNYYECENRYKENPDDFDFDELCEDMIGYKKIFQDKLEEANKIISDDELRSNAHEIMLNKKLDMFVNNYILEHTPLGNVYMRYNNSKKSFEYFSNNTIPYRYLEPLGRKYVMTYWCKPLFVDIEEELKKAEIKFDEEAEQKKEDDRKRSEFIAANPRNVVARMKNYNKDTKNQMTMKPQMKNRASSNFVLPPQIRANLPNVKQGSDKHLLKEKANRYTWEGRLTDFNPLKKIDRKIVDKNLSMSYSDFKKMQKK